MKRLKHYFLSNDIFYYINNDLVTKSEFEDYMKYTDCYTEVDVDNKLGSVIIWFSNDEKLIASIHIFY